MSYTRAEAPLPIITSKKTEKFEPPHTAPPLAAPFYDENSEEILSGRRPCQSTSTQAIVYEEEFVISAAVVFRSNHGLKQLSQTYPRFELGMV